MPHVPIPAAAMISDEVKDLIRSHDDSLLANQRLFVSVVTAARDSNAAFSDTHRVFSALHATSTKMLDARWAVGDTLKLLRAMAPSFGARPVLEGCAATCPINSDAHGGGAAVCAPAPVQEPVVA
jgi:hypothetical protein